MMSIFSLVQIAALTSVMTINFGELLTLYSYSLPNLIFYTLPISFFLGLIISLSKLSSEYELIVITSFGLNPLKIFKVFFPIALTFSIVLLIISIGLIQKSKYESNLMLLEKQKEANFNIKASEFGQKFGDWLIYITNKDGQYYSNVKLFKADDESEQFVLSKDAVLNNDSGELSFSLNEGRSFFMENDQIRQIDFKRMDINDSLAKNALGDYTDAYHFWKDRLRLQSFKERFITYIVGSLLPLISLFMVIAFGYYNPRYEKNRAVLYAVSFAVLFNVLSNVMVKNIGYHTIYALPLIWIALSLYLYNRRVKKVY